MPAHEHTRPSPIDLGVARATFWGLFFAGLIVAGIYFGSRRFKDFDPALVSYAGASVFAAFGLGYRYSMWLQRPPTRLYWWRGWKIFLSPAKLPRNIVLLFVHLGGKFVAQRFIWSRSRVRWAAHWLIAWGCIIAALVTFPLSFGWIRFETALDSQLVYRVFVFGEHVHTFPLGTLLADVTFHVLDITAVMVLGGIFISLWRRSQSREAIAVQQFPNDLLPLALLFAVSVTGLFLTVSTVFLRGFHYIFLSQLHAATVIFTLLYLPFGKFFHIFQRPAQLGVWFYRDEGARGAQAQCARCGQPFASRLHVEDLKRVQAQLDIDYTQSDGAHYQDVCPRCRRKSVALTQSALKATARGT